MNSHETELFTNGYMFARAYARNYGMRDALTAVEKLVQNEREPHAYCKGAVKALAELADEAAGRKAA
jgi:hypothetical protein